MTGRREERRADLSVLELVEQAQAGDDDAFTRLYEQYTEHLKHYLQSKISTRFQTRFDTDEVVISMWETVAKGLQQEGRFTFDEDEDVWRLLVSISLNKLRRNIERESAEKRGAHREQALHDQQLDAIARRPSMEEQVHAGELIDQIVQRVDAETAMILHMRLDGDLQAEIARKLDIDERTVRRKMQRVRQVVEQLLADDV